MRLPRIPLALFVCCCYGTGAEQNTPSAQAAAATQPGQPAKPAPPAPEITQHDGPATFASRSNLVQVPVVVRDKQGHAIGNLTKDDFFLFDKGKPQFIAKFLVEKAGKPYIQAVGATPVAPETPGAVPSVEPFANENPPGPLVPERFIAYLFDDVHLNAGDLSRMRKATLEHIDNSLDPVTRVAIVTTSGLGALDFTDDIAKIHATLNSMQPYTPSPRPIDCPNISLYMADQIINKNDPSAIAVAVADATACTASLSTTSTNDVQAMVRSAAIASLSIGEGETRLSMDGVQNLSKRMSAMPGSRSIVVISSGFVIPGDDLRPNLMALLEQAIRSNVSINTLDARGVYTVIPGGDASTRTVSTSNLTLRTSFDAAAQLAQQDILEELASGTGGTFFHNDNGFEEGLQQLTKQPEYIYLLGFAPSDLKYDGTYHGLKVTLKDSAARTLQARRGYYAPKRPNDPEEASKEDIREAVFSRDELQDIPIDMRLQFFKSTPTNARLSVISRVDVKTLHFRRDQDRSKDTLVLVAGLFDRNGNFVSGTQRTVEMNLRDQTLTALGTSGVSLRADFEVTPGAYTIRVVVRDAEGQMMAARNGAVQIP
jgi:VWFA-related protein